MAINLLAWREKENFYSNLIKLAYLIFSGLITITFIFIIDKKILNLINHNKNLNLVMEKRISSLPAPRNLSQLQKKLKSDQMEINLLTTLANNQNKWLKTIDFLRAKWPVEFSLNQITWSIDQLELLGSTTSIENIASWTKLFESTPVFNQIIAHNLTIDEKTQSVKFVITANYTQHG